MVGLSSFTILRFARLTSRNLVSKSNPFVMSSVLSKEKSNCCGTDDSTRKNVKDYYGKVLTKSDDLKTNACTTGGGMPPHLKKVFPLLSDEVISRYYGCGIVVPDLLQGCSVLDLGCGAGRDCFLISNLVGENGKVVGVDMTDEQLDVANRNIDFHTKSFGFAKPNVEFKKGYIERLDECNLESESFDVIVSNCVINLSPDKEAVLKEAFRVLKPGGELYFSDVYADRRVSKHLIEDPVLFGECLSGALYWNDFLRIAKKCGFTDPRLVSDSPIGINNKAIEEKIGHIKFFSATYRLFKIAELESDCEDYGQAVIYKGTIPNLPTHFALDAHHKIETGRVFPVCRNTLNMLQKTRFSNHFEYIGAGETHFGIFKDCGKLLPFASSNDQPSEKSSGGCC